MDSQSAEACLTLRRAQGGVLTPDLSHVAVPYLMETPHPQYSTFPHCHPQATAFMCPAQPLLRVLSSLSPAWLTLSAPKF